MEIPEPRAAQLSASVRQLSLSAMRTRKARRAEDTAMGDMLQPWHLIVLAVVAFLLFGAKRLPELGKGLGEGLKGFREGIRGITDPAPTTTAQNVQQQNTTPAPQNTSTETKS
jgi:sec-independent protein translocase protein TatA